MMPRWIDWIGNLLGIVAIGMLIALIAVKYFGA
jgi:hypothetical protein